jgi:hypothetical protein
MLKNLKALLVNMIKGGIGGAKTKTGLKLEKSWKTLREQFPLAKRERLD